MTEIWSYFDSNLHRFLSTIKLVPEMRTHFILSEVGKWVRPPVRRPVGDIVPIPVPRLAPQPHSDQQLAQNIQDSQSDGKHRSVGSLICIISFPDSMMHNIQVDVISFVSLSRPRLEIDPSFLPCSPPLLTLSPLGIVAGKSPALKGERGGRLKSRQSPDGI